MHNLTTVSNEQAETASDHSPQVIRPEKSAPYIVTVGWNISVPDTAGPMQLLTITGLSVLGNWHGALGEHFIGWASLGLCGQTTDTLQ